MTRAPVGFFGKIPAHGDFVRANVGDPLVQRFTRWLEEASEACHRAGAVVPRDPARFLFRSTGDGGALVGVLRGSQDRVGRQFPLAIFVPAQGPLVESGVAAVPLAFRRFLDAASALVASDPPSAGALQDGAAALPLPRGEDAPAVEDAVRRAAARAGGDFLGRLFGGGASAGRYYAVHTFLSACAPLRGREPSRAETVLDCPVEDDADVWTWIELARRALAWTGAPSFLHREGAPGRLLLSLGPPPPAALPSLCDPGFVSQKVWPLTTSSGRALEAAPGALGPARVSAMDRADVAVGELLTELTAKGGR
jgi:type VI secretion system protein ImpM